MPIRNLAFIGDCDTITDYGWYRINGATNAGGAGANSWLLSLPHTNPSLYSSQIIYPRGSGDFILRREKSSGTWGDWNKCFFYTDLASMASALGAYGTLSNNTTFDSLTHNGCWKVSSNHPNNPMAAQGVLSAVFSGDSYGYQIFKSSGATMIRHYFDGWATEWQRLDNFNCNTAADLASLLGVISFGELNSGDLNNIIDNSIYLLHTPTSISNCPTSTSRGFIFTMRQNSYIAQTIFRQEGMIYFRWGTKSGNSGVFGAWMVVELNAVQ